MIAIRRVNQIRWKILNEFIHKKNLAKEFVTLRGHKGWVGYTSWEISWSRGLPYLSSPKTLYGLVYFLPSFCRGHGLEAVRAVVRVDLVRDAEPASDVETMTTKVEPTQRLRHSAAAFVSDKSQNRFVERTRSFDFRQATRRRLSRRHFCRKISDFYIKLN